MELASRSEDLIRKTISKIVQCILLSRIDIPNSQKKLNKSFHLEAEESESIQKTLESIIFSSRNGIRTLFVLEIHFDENAGLGLNTIVESWRIIFEPLKEIDNSIELPKFYRNVIILVRTVYAMLRNIPAYTLFRNFTKNRSSTCSMKYQIRICDMQTITAPLFPLSTNIKIVPFTAIPTPLGSLRIDLSYKDSLMREKSLSSQLGLESQFIIKDYNNYSNNNNNNNEYINNNNNNNNNNIIVNNDNNLSNSLHRDTYPSSFPLPSRMNSLQDLIGNNNNNNNNNNSNNYNNINNNMNNMVNIMNNNNYQKPSSPYDNGYPMNNYNDNNNNNNNMNYGSCNDNTNNFSNNQHSNPIGIPGSQNNRHQQNQQQYQYQSSSQPQQQPPIQQYSSSYNTKPSSFSSSPPFAINSSNKIGSFGSNNNNNSNNYSSGSSPPFGSNNNNILNGSGGISQPLSIALPIRQVNFQLPNNQSSGISPNSYNNQQQQQQLQQKNRASSAPITIQPQQQQQQPSQNFPKSSSSGTKSPPFHVSISPFKEPSTLDFYNNNSNSGGGGSGSGGLGSNNSNGGMVGNNSNNNLTLLGGNSGSSNSNSHNNSNNNLVGMVGNNSSNNLTLLGGNNNSNIGNSGNNNNNNPLFNPLYQSSSSPGSINSFGASGIERLNLSMKNSKISQIHGPLLLSEHHHNNHHKELKLTSPNFVYDETDADDAVFVSTLTNSKPTTTESEIAEFLKLCKIAPPLNLFNSDDNNNNITNSQHSLQLGNEIMQLSNINFVNKPTIIQQPPQQPPQFIYHPQNYQQQNF